ncbi:Glycine receptor subunit alpha-3 [Branchiostoma belcheri]|nr:Glycine receptor subunit alpha-3 [Branchiostoma belcheri]
MAAAGSGNYRPGSERSPQARSPQAVTWSALNGLPEGSALLNTDRWLNVTVAAHLQGFGSVSEETMDFQAILRIVREWRDPRLLPIPEGRPYLPVDPQAVLWTPHIDFSNFKEVKVSTVPHKEFQKEPNMWVTADGKVNEVTLYEIKVTCSMSLQNYPLDNQLCSIRMDGFEGVLLAWGYPYIWSDHGPGPLLTDATAIHSQFRLREIEMKAYVNSFNLRVEVSILSYDAKTFVHMGTPKCHVQRADKHCPKDSNEGSMISNETVIGKGCKYLSYVCDYRPAGKGCKYLSYVCDYRPAGKGCKYLSYVCDYRPAGKGCKYLSYVCDYRPAGKGCKYLSYVCDYRAADACLVDNSRCADTLSSPECDYCTAFPGTCDKHTQTCDLVTNETTKTAGDDKRDTLPLSHLKKLVAAGSRKNRSYTDQIKTDPAQTRLKQVLHRPDYHIQDQFTQSIEWTLRNSPLHGNFIVYEKAFNGLDGEYLWKLETIQLHLSRRLAYHLMQMYIPSTCIVIMSWISFWFSIDTVPARVCLGATTVLTMTAQSSRTAPRQEVSYVRAVDVWVVVCQLFVIAALLEYAAVDFIRRREDHKPQMMDQNNGTLQVVCTDPQVPDPVTRTSPCRPRSPADKAKRIDYICRVAFPTLFILFNIIYWPFYLCF